MERFSLFPLKDVQSWQYYKKAVSRFWTPEEFNYDKDYQDFLKFSKTDQNVIKNVLAFFAASDAIVNTNIIESIRPRANLEQQYFYDFQIMMENIHTETYNLLIDNIIKNNDEKQMLFDSLNNYNTIKKKADWALKWIGNDKPLDENLVAFGCVERIHFSSSFNLIAWIKSLEGNLMPGLCTSNRFISKDENLHGEFAAFMLKKLNTFKKEKVIEIVKEATEIELDFIDEIFPSDGVFANLDKKWPKEHAKRCANVFLKDLNIEEIYDDVGELPNYYARFENKSYTNFFEGIEEYKRVNIEFGNFDINNSDF